MSQQPYAPPAALRWNQLACDAIYYTKTPPTIAARALAIIHTAMYDAWSIFQDGCELSTTTGDLYQKLGDSTWNTKDNRRQAYSFAAYRCILSDGIFANPLPTAFKEELKTFMVEDLSYDAADTNQNTNNPAGIGNLSARLVLECRQGDKSNQENGFKDWTGYVPTNPPQPERTKNINHWQPGLVNKKPQAFLTPHWGQVVPFALCGGGQFRPPAPLKNEDNPEAFKAQGVALTEISAKLTEKQKLIAEFWAGMHEDRYPGMINDPTSGYWATPPAQCCRIAGEIIVKKQLSAGAVIPLFFALTNTLLDASIATWDSKRCYDYVRPVTLIAEWQDNDTFNSWGGPCRGTVEMQGEGWCPYLTFTPPFAEYVSGHSTFTAATAEIIKCFFGSNEYGGSLTIPAKGSRVEPACTPSADLVLSWPTLDDMATGPDGAGMSRLYGGIHFMAGIEEGSILGKKVALSVWEKACKFLTGEA